MPINLAAIHDRGAPALLGSHHAEEADARGPCIHVRTFVVIQNGFVFGIGSRSVNLSGNTFAGQVTILRVNFFVDGGGHAFELLRRGKCESAEQNSAVLMQFGIDVVAIISCPIGEVYLVGRRLDHERQRLIVAKHAFADWIEMRKINGFAPDGANRLFSRNGVFHKSPLNNGRGTYLGGDFRFVERKMHFFCQNVYHTALTKSPIWL